MGPPSEISKYNSKLFKPQSKGGSPIVKKNNLFENTSPTNKLCFSNNPGRIKKVKKTGGVNEKAFTETGPIIQRIMNQDKPEQKDKEKVLFTYTDDKNGGFS